MGAYLSNEQYLAKVDTVELKKRQEIGDVKSMEDCKTQDEMSLYFRTYNDENSLEDYCDLAKRKLPKLSNLQKQQSNQLITHNEVDNRVGWDAYCHILSVEQINYVGW